MRDNKIINPVTEKVWEYKGYICLILFMPQGYRCGYVALTKTSRFYKKGYYEIPVCCHGGLTYAESFLRCHEGIKEIWWIGFDTGHCMDAMDYETAYKYFADYPEIIKQLDITKNIFFRSSESEVRTLEYCKYECENIVKQIIRLEEEKCQKK